MYEDFIYPLTLSKKELYSLRNKVTGEQRHLMSFHLDEERSEIWDYFVFTNEDSKVVIKCCKDEETDWQYKATHVETDAGWVSIKLVALAQLYGGWCSIQKEEE